MAEMDLKAYTARAVELEVAIYAQKKLMDAHKPVLERQRPAKPMRRKIEVPQRPTMVPCIYQKNVGLYFIIGCMIVIGVFGVPLLFTKRAFIGLVFIGIGLLGVKLAFNERANKREAEENNRVMNEEYEKEKIEYQEEIKKYKEKESLALSDYNAAFAQYEKDLLAYENNKAAIIQQHASTLDSLEKALQALYDENVIFSKYRNMVAITTINEYLMSGRCFELEGADGAYNLYEMELRQNIVIGQLSMVLNNLEQIRSNQFSLYQELLRANDSVNQIIYELRDLNETTKLNTYFAEVAAKAAISPKITTGIIY